MFQQRPIPYSKNPIARSGLDKAVAKGQQLFVQ